MKNRLTVLLVALCIAVTVAAAHDPKNTAKASFDASFMKKMVMHHEMGLPMSEMCMTKATHSELKQMCVKDLADQKQEIATMKSWMESGGSASSPVASSSAKAEPGHADMKNSDEMKHARHEGMKKGDMMVPGMKKMKEKEDHLRQSSGAAFDKDYLKIMSEHHQSAIAMARPCTAKAQKAELKQLCRDIVTNQTEARKQMMSWRSEWYGGSQSSTK